MRAFLAIPLPAELREELAAVGQGIEGLRAQRAETIHLTLRFLGEIRDPAPIVAAVRPVAAKYQAFDMSLKGLGAFPKTAAARVAWVGIEAGDLQAGALAKGVEQALRPLGFPREKRPFHGHITLGRFPEPQRFKEADREREFGRARADRVILYSSTLTPEGAVHEIVADLPLS